MKRIAIIAILAAILGTSVSALAAEPQLKPDSRGLYEQMFESDDLCHQF